MIKYSGQGIECNKYADKRLPWNNWEGSFAFQNSAVRRWLHCQRAWFHYQCMCVAVQHFTRETDEQQQSILPISTSPLCFIKLCLISVWLNKAAVHYTVSVDDCLLHTFAELGNCLWSWLHTTVFRISPKCMMHSHCSVCILNRNVQMIDGFKFQHYHRIVEKPGWNRGGRWN